MAIALASGKMSFGQPPQLLPNTTSSIGPTTTATMRPSLTHRQSTIRLQRASEDDRRAHWAQQGITLHSLHRLINHRQQLLRATTTTSNNSTNFRHVKITFLYCFSTNNLSLRLFHSSNNRPHTATNKFTLHSTQLPRPQYPVSVRVSAVACPPPYRRSTTFTAFSSSPSRSSLVWQNQNQVQATATRLMDTKGAKHAANISTKRAGTAMMNGR